MARSEGATSCDSVSLSQRLVSFCTERTLVDRERYWKQSIILESAHVKFEFVFNSVAYIYTKTCQIMCSSKGQSTSSMHKVRLREQGRWGRIHGKDMTD